MKIEIKNPTVRPRTITGGRGDFTLHQLEAWAHLDPDGYPEKVVLNVEQGDKFEVGMYKLLDTTFRVGSFNRLEVGNAKLAKQPVSPTK